MIVTLTEEKKRKLKTLVLNLLRINKPTIRYLAKVMKTIISCMPATILGPLFYRYLEHDKVTSLRWNKGDFDAPAKIGPERKQELESWFENTGNIERPIALLSIDGEYFVICLQFWHTRDRWCHGLLNTRWYMSHLKAKIKRPVFQKNATK